MKFISIKFIWLVLLPLLFLQGNCNQEEGRRNVHVRIVGSSSATACDAQLVGRKNLRLIITIQELDPVTGQYRFIDQQDLGVKNTWEDGFFMDFSLPLKPYRILAQAVQDCSACCSIAGSSCSGSPNLNKIAQLYFYNHMDIPADGGYFPVELSLYNCSCVC